MNRCHRFAFLFWVIWGISPSFAVTSTYIHDLPYTHLTFQVEELCEDKSRSIFLEVTLLKGQSFRKCSLDLSAYNVSQNFELKCTSTQSILANDFLEDAQSVDDVFAALSASISNIPPIVAPPTDAPHALKYGLTLNGLRQSKPPKFILTSDRLTHLHIVGDSAPDDLQAPHLTGNIFFRPGGIIDFPKFSSKYPQCKVSIHNVFLTSVPNHCSADQLNDAGCPSLAYAGSDKGWMDLGMLTKGANRFLMGHFVPGDANPWHIAHVCALTSYIPGLKKPAPIMKHAVHDVTSTELSKFLAHLSLKKASNDAFIEHLLDVTSSFINEAGELPRPIEEAFKKAIQPELKALDTFILEKMIVQIPSLYSWVRHSCGLTLSPIKETALALRAEGLSPNAAFFCAMPSEMLIKILKYLTARDRLAVSAAFPKIHDVVIASKLELLPQLLPNFPKLTPQLFTPSMWHLTSSVQLPTSKPVFTKGPIEGTISYEACVTEHAEDAPIVKAYLTLKYIVGTGPAIPFLRTGPLYMRSAQHMEDGVVIKEHLPFDLLSKYFLVRFARQHWKKVVQGDFCISDVCEPEPPLDATHGPS